MVRELRLERGLSQQKLDQLADSIGPKSRVEGRQAQREPKEHLRLAEALGVGGLVGKVLTR